MIVQKGPRKFQLLSRKTGRVLGTHPSYAAALRQERAIKASQARAARRNPSARTRRNPVIQGESYSKKVMKLVEHQIEMNDGRCPTCGQRLSAPYYRRGKDWQEGCVSIHHIGHVHGAFASTDWYFRPKAKEIRRKQATKLSELAE